MINAAMTDLSKAIGEALGRCLEQGMALPFVATCVSANGSVMAVRYDAAADKHGFSPTPLASHTEVRGYALPVNIMITDRDGEALRLTIEPSGSAYH